MVTVALLTLATVAAALVVKQQFSPSAKDAWFEPDTDKLRLVPEGIVLIRSTHFPHNSGKIRHIHEEEILARTLGRNVTLREIIAEAYDCNPSRVVLPSDAPKGDFDFLVTAPGDAREHLQTVLAKKLGYAAHRETQDADLLILKIENPRLPGLAVSPRNENPDLKVADGKLYFKHQPLSLMLDGLQAGLSQPILDQTGLTNFYDFSVVWNERIEKKMKTGAFDFDGVKKVLSEWGLGLEPDTAPLDMFVVKKAH